MLRLLEEGISARWVSMIVLRQMGRIKCLLLTDMLGR